ncbi:hypothetical protein [Micromonospora sp. NPDC005367]
MQQIAPECRIFVENRVINIEQCATQLRADQLEFLLGRLTIPRTGIAG